MAGIIAEQNSYFSDAWSPLGAHTQVNEELEYSVLARLAVSALGSKPILFCTAWGSETYIRVLYGVLANVAAYAVCFFQSQYAYHGSHFVHYRRLPEYIAAP